MIVDSLRLLKVSHRIALVLYKPVEKCLVLFLVDYFPMNKTRYVYVRSPIFLLFSCFIFIIIIRDEGLFGLLSVR